MSGTDKAGIIFLIVIFIGFNLSEILDGLVRIIEAIRGNGNSKDKERNNNAKRNNPQ